MYVFVWAHGEALWMSWPSLRRLQGLCVSLDGEGDGGELVPYASLAAQCGNWYEHGKLPNPTLYICLSRSLSRSPSLLCSGCIYPAAYVTVECGLFCMPELV